MGPHSSCSCRSPLPQPDGALGGLVVGPRSTEGVLRAELPLQRESPCSHLRIATMRQLMGRKDYSGC